MSMLERTAASLEPCSFQRMLPSTRNSLKSRRQLHTTFWQHGAADIELSNAWLTLVRPRPPLDPRDGTPRSGQDKDGVSGSLTASTFLLDFLYPPGAVSFLKKVSPRTVERYEQPRSIRRSSPRAYTSYSVSQTESSTQQAPRFEPPPSRAGLDVKIISQPATRRRSPKEAQRVGYHEEIATPSGHKPGAVPSGESHPPDPVVLRDMLGEEKTGMFKHVWTLYSRLEPAVQAELTPGVLVHLAKSQRAEEARKVVNLFPTVGADKWDDTLIAAAIKSHLLLRRFPEAVAIFRTALQTKRLAKGFDPLLAYGLKLGSARHILAACEPLRTVQGWEGLDFGQLDEISAVPKIAERIAQLSAASASDDKEALQQTAPQVDLLARFIALKLIAIFQPADAVYILDRAKEPPAYEEFIRLCIDREQPKLAAQMYRIYRGLPDVRIRVPILHLMLKIFPPNDVKGMEQVMEDWYSRYERLDHVAYRTFISFHADRGDVRAVERLTREFAQHYPKVFAKGARALRAVLSPLLHVHAVRGEVDMVRQTIERIKEDYDQTPGIVEYAILLNAHAKAGDYEGAINTFAELCETLQPNNVSFGTLMGMAGSRGDLQFTLDLSKMAEDLGISGDVPMLDAIVEAYCQNDRFKEAEALCHKTTKSQKVASRSPIMWNTLLQHYADRRDLVNVNRILELMTTLDVSYNSETYDRLLTALVNCRQSHHALQLVRLAESEGLFDVTLNHYVLLMAAFIESKEPHQAFAVNRAMSERGFPETADRMSKVIDAISCWEQLPPKLQAHINSRQAVGAALRAFYDSVGREDFEKQEGGGRPTPRLGFRAASRQFSQIIVFLTRMRQYATVQDIMAIYADMFPDKADTETMPLRLLHSLLLTAFYEGKDAETKQLWEVILRRTTQLSKPSHLAALVPSSEAEDRRSILPSQRYLICDALKTMQRVYIGQNDADGLMELVKDVIASGFQLDSKNWNYYVQGLARLKKWKEAFGICEEMLMPQWTGWYRMRTRQNAKNQIPLALRRVGSAPRYLRPISYTLLVLAKEYMDLERMTPWSHEAAVLYADINKECGGVVYAIKTMVRSSSPLETRIFSKGPRNSEDQPSKTAETAAQRLNSRSNDGEEGVALEQGAELEERDPFAALQYAANLASDQNGKQ